jgi:catechol 2,3-dioxygenase-like lactoylglutathione lyase family enzyme
MALRRLDNVAMVVNDLDGAIRFFSELGMELEGRASPSGDLVDRLVALKGSRSEIAMMRPPSGDGGIELTRWLHPPAVAPDPRNLPANARGMGRVMFEVDDIDDVVERLQALGGELVGEIVQYQNSYRLCYMRGPEGIVFALAQPTGLTAE